MEKGKELREQKNYKDTVFRMLFRKKQQALDLYNGVNDTDYRDETLLHFNTLENAIYMNVHNDLSFLVTNQLNLYEHQSTLPVNMPLRDLFYIADILQKTLMDKTIYSSKRLTIPNPNFVVFYNGTGAMPERMELKLSDSYAVPTENPALELKVTVLNINPGMNNRLKEKCPALEQYMLYVEQVREYAKHMELRDAVEKAVDDCIRAGILRDFLMEQKAEVVKMSIYEFDEEREMKLIREDEREIGREEGKEIGREEGKEIGREEGKEIGREEGKEIGRKEGKEIGREEGLSVAKSDAICKLLSAKGNVSDDLCAAILKESSLEVLDAWFALAIEVNTAQEFEEQYTVKL